VKESIWLTIRTMYKFSVITPVHLWNQDRVDKFLHCIEIMKRQTFKDFEWIVVDDGSTIPFKWDILNMVGKNVNLIKKQHEERVIAYNRVFKETKGEWFSLLDSDDLYFNRTLEIFNDVIKEYPTYKMFNFGCVYNHKDGKRSIRDPFEPVKKEIGHEEFGGGKIVNGTFIWHKSVYEDLGGFPLDKIENIDCTPINYGGLRSLSMATPYDFAAAAQMEFPEIRKYFMVDHVNEPKKIIKELGNPWGQDYYLFYKYTRKYHSLPIKKYVYIVNLK